MRRLLNLGLLLLIMLLLIPATLLAQDAPKVTVVTCWGGPEGIGFNAVNAVFTEQTGIEVEHIDDRDCHLLPQIMASAGNPPDLSGMPRPGVMAELAREGLIIPLTSGDDPVLTPEFVAANYGQALIDLGSVDGEFYGVISAVSSKSLAWRRSDVFEDIGEDAPTTWDEFIEYLDILAEEGIAPLALGALDGWTLTDFFENLYLNIAGPDMYHKLFVTHEVEWTDPTVISALIEAGADVHARVVPDLTPLHIAAVASDNPAVVEVLVEAGADPNARGVDGLTPLHVAAGGNTNPAIIAAVVGFGILLVLSLGSSFISSALTGTWANFFDQLGFGGHFNDFDLGIIDSANIVYFVSVTALFLFLSIRALESRRWR